jgi:hypothetical protein
MANLNEVDQFDAGIYQIETTDPVLGGPNGIANTQAKALANRTKNLNTRLATVEAQKAPLASPALTGTPTAPTAAAGTNTTQIATAAFVQAAIAALINSSPAALDTLNELATALGNDPNFATTITNALALKAPLASPALTGNPTAPTAAGGDNDTSVATTAFVQRSVNGRLVKSVAGGANVTLTAAEVDNGILEFNGALTANISVIVPNASGNWTVLNRTSGAFTLTVKTAAGTGIVVAQGKQQELSCDGTNVFQSNNDYTDTVLTGTPTAPTAAAGTNTTQLANTAFVQAAIAALINSSPAALDTLNELATALGNDPNFATTMTNALALKAPLASPSFTGTANIPRISGSPAFAAESSTEGGQINLEKPTSGTTLVGNVGIDIIGDKLRIFDTAGTNKGVFIDLAALAANVGSQLALLASPAFTGNPTAPTAAQFDNDTSLATTAFVQRALGNMQGAAVVSGSTTLGVADVGKVIVANANNITLTLPSAAAVPAGAVYSFLCFSSSVTIAAAASQNIGYGNGAVATVTLNPGDTLTLARSDNNTDWWVIGGSNQLAKSTFMAGANFTTPAQFDNTTKLATTEFVQRALGARSSARNYSLAAQLVLTAADIGSNISFNAGFNQTAKLPPTAGLPVGAVITLARLASGYTLTVTPDSGTAIIDSGGGLVSSFVVQQGEDASFVWNGTSWTVIGAALFRSTNFVASKTGNGYQKLPGGLILQWGDAGSIGGGASVTVTMPLAWPGGWGTLIAVPGTTGPGTCSFGVQFISNSQFKIHNGGSVSASAPWMAIGF